MKIRILLSRSEAGRLIGVSGDNIRQVRMCTKAKLFIDTDESSNRVVIISGNEEEIITALEMISSSIENPSGGMGRKHLKLLLEDRFCKYLVEKSAKHLQCITKATGVKLTVAPLTLPGSTERLVRIDENRGNVIDGVKKIIALVGKESMDLSEMPY